MQTLHYRRAVLAVIGILAQSGCGGRAGSQENNTLTAGGTVALICTPGDTRECVGPGACRGGQRCGNEGSWGPCECGPTGAGASFGSGGSANSGGGSAMTGPTFTGGKTSILSGGSTATGGRTTGGVAGFGGSTATGGRTTGGVGGIGGHTTGGVGGAGGSGVGGAGGRTTGGVGGIGGWGGLGGTPTGGVPVGGNKPTGGVATGGTTTNHPPQITGLGFYPNPVTTNDTLYIYVEANDPDYDKIGYSYAWAVNGKIVGSNASQLSGYSYFSKGDSITVTVTPSDGKITGDPATTQPIIVANSPPQLSNGATLTPSPYANDDAALTCSASATDPDGDTITYSYNWYNGGVSSNYHDATLPATATTLGEFWYCEAVASDGTSNATGGFSAQTSIASTVSGIYRADTLWQASKSPYILTGRIQIAPGVTLKIEPGVTVYGNSYSIESWGSIEAVGTADKPIYIENLYTYDNSTTDKPGKFTLSYVEHYGGALLSSAASAQVTLSDCVLRYLETPLTLGATSSAAQSVERNLFDSTCGIYAFGSVTLNSNTFTNTVPGNNDLAIADSLSGTGNNFYPNTDIIVFAGSQSVDLHGCYWGGLTDTEIPDRILDNNDDLTILGEITYLPTLTAASTTAPAVDKSYFP